jgi:hypothetical protein
MSFDFATDQLCTHEVFFESIQIDPISKQTAVFPFPPSSKRVQVYIDGVEVPSTGLYSFAKIPLIKKEPYRIKSGINDLLYISLGFDTPRFVQLISGSNVKASELAGDLQGKLPDLSIGVENKRVVFKSRQRLKGTAFQFHDPRWTDTTSSLPTTARVLNAYQSIGVIPGRAATGKRILPGWRVEKVEGSADQTEKQLIFDSIVPSNDSVIEVNYVTTQFNCRRCHGSRIEFDYSILNNTYETVFDTDLLAQEFDKFLFTKIGSHWKWNWLGSGLIDRIGGKGSTGNTTTTSLITFDVSQAFRTYQNIKQQQDSRVPQQQVSDAEYPYQLVNVNVQTLPDDPTVAIVTTIVSNRSRVSVPLKRVIGNPNPFTLQGDPIQNIRLIGGNSQFRLRG